MRLRIKALEQERPVILSLCGLELTIDGLEKEEVITIVEDGGGVVIHDNDVVADHRQTDVIQESAYLESPAVASTEIVSSDMIPVNTVHSLPVSLPMTAHARSSDRMMIQNTIPDDELFHQLTALRKQLAIQQNVPPYVIFNDKSLREMAQKLPEDLTSFGAINGVGKSKLEKYGRIFLDAIRTYKGRMAG